MAEGGIRKLDRNTAEELIRIGMARRSVRANAMIEEFQS
jgi:hypothetical protein